MRNTENEKRRGELALVKLVWMDMSVPSIYQVGISLFFGLGSRGNKGLPFSCRWALAQARSKTSGRQGQHSHSLTCVYGMLFLFLSFFSSESMPERGNVLKGRENTPVFLSVLLVQN